ncbi:MAG: hypothetical protein EA417_20160 [Gammaproteobacteria bacterium]|nr:MAG: hypothetical protein EA417_20160 [Gammaproteobacteria bacterium]
MVALGRVLVMVFVLVEQVWWGSDGQCRHPGQPEAERGSTGAGRSPEGLGLLGRTWIPALRFAPAGMTSVAVLRSG